MVHLREIPEQLREALINQELPDYGNTQWVNPKPLNKCRVALISTAGLHRREDPSFTPGAGDYRIIPDNYDMNSGPSDPEEYSLWLTAVVNPLPALGNFHLFY